MKFASEQLKREITRLTGIPIPHAKFVTDASAEIFINESAIGSMVGTRGENIRQLEQDLNLKLKVNSIQDIPRALRKRIERTSSFNEDIDQWRSQSGRQWEHNGGKTKKGRRKVRKNRKK